MLKLLSALEPNNNAKTILSWLVAAERPFTLSEISSLFSVDYHRGTVLDKGVDIQSAIHSLKPILSIHEDIVRLRHNAVQSSLHTLIDQGKTQDEVLAAKTTADFDAKVPNSAETTQRFVTQVYAELKAAK